MNRRKKISLARELLRRGTRLSKRGVARQFGIARSTLYLTSKQREKDRALLALVLEVRRDHPHYGHRRVALVLKRNPKAIRRIMRKYGLRVRRRRRRHIKQSDLRKPASSIPNRIRNLCPIAPSVIWVGDFTYLVFHGMFVYFSTVMDLYTREIVGVAIGLHHSAQLVVDALEDAKRKRKTPAIFHSDQGSEYDGALCRTWLMAHRILPSQSEKSHPWENGHQESFYGRFKEEVGDLDRFTSLDELIEAIHRQIHYYNTKRIHSVLKMTPREYFDREEKRWNRSENLSTGVS